MPAVDKKQQEKELLKPNPLTFNKDVYRMVRLIPEGRVASYGDIAKQLGFPKHSRLVGQALKLLPRDLSSPYLPQLPPPEPELDAPSSSSASSSPPPPPEPETNPDWVPWHRVLSSSGVISPREGGVRAVQRQADYLRAEEVEVNDGARAGGQDAYGLAGVDGGRVSMAKYRWDWGES